MKVDTLKQYLSQISSFWRSERITVRRQILSSDTAKEHGVSVTSSPLKMTPISQFTEEHRQILFKNDQAVLVFLSDLLEKHILTGNEFSSSELSRIAQAILLRLDEPMIRRYSAANPHYSAIVYDTFKSIYQSSIIGLCQITRGMITNELSRFSHGSDSAHFSNVLVLSQRTALSQRGDISALTRTTFNPVGSSFKRSKSLVDLVKTRSISTIPGSDLTYLSRMLTGIDNTPHKDERHLLLDIQRGLVGRILDFNKADPRRRPYRLLQNVMHENSRAMLYLEAKTSVFAKKSKAHEILRLTDLNHLIYTLDFSNNFVLSKFSVQDFQCLKKHLGTFTLSSGAVLGRLKGLAYRDTEFTWADYQQLKKFLHSSLRKQSVLAEKDIFELKKILELLLVPPRKKYIEQRLQKSISMRLGNRFLLDLEREFRDIFAAYCDSSALSQISFHLENRSLFAYSDYTSIFCNELFQHKELSLGLFKGALKRQCNEKELELRALYQSYFSEACRAIPARLSFEMAYIDDLKSLQSSIVRQRGVMTQNELRRRETYSAGLRATLPNSHFEKLNFDAESFIDLSLNELKAIVSIMKRREEASRNPQHYFADLSGEVGTFHPTLYTEDPINLYYIEFARRVVKAMNHLAPPPKGLSALDLIQVLFQVQNTMCPNIAYAIKNLDFQYPDRLLKSSMVEFNQFSDPTLTEAVTFTGPELYGMYLHGDFFYSILGLFLVNNATLCKETAENGKVYITLDIKNIKQFQLMRTLDSEGQFRALSLSEIGNFWSQEYRVKSTKGTSSFPLWVKGADSIKFYHSFQFLISELVIRAWGELGKPNQDLIFKLITLYLNTDPLLHKGDAQLWKTGLAQWSDDLIYTGKKGSRKPRSRADVYALYGQVVDGEMYMFQLLHRLIKDERVTDELMIKLAVWYLNKCEGDSDADQHRRLIQLREVFISAFERSNSHNMLYFNESGTRFEKLASGLSDKGKLLPNYRKFMIPTLEVDEDLVYHEPITDIPFEHALLSEDNHTIYDLRLSAERYEQTGKFINVALNRPFTLLERQRILTHAAYRNCALSIETAHEAQDRAQVQTGRLSSSMVRALRVLLDETHLLDKEIFHELTAGHSVKHERIEITPQMYAQDRGHCDKLILKIIFKRIDKFIFDFYLQLPGAEKALLDAYLIHIPDKGETIPFSELLKQFTDPTAATMHFCLDKVTEPLFSTVFAYDKYTRFRNWLEITEKRGQGWLDSLRAQAPNLEYSDTQNSALLQQLKRVIFRLKACSSIPSSLYAQIETKLSSKNLDQPLNGLNGLYEDLKVNVNAALTRVSNQVIEYKQRSFSVPLELQKQKEVFKRVNTILNTSLVSEDDFDDMVFYDTNRIESSLARCLRTWNKSDLPRGLETIYQSSLEKSASKIAYIYQILPNKRNVPEYLSILIQNYRAKGIDITQPSAIKTPPNHMLDIDMNVAWERYLQSLDGAMCTRMRVYLARQASPSNSFDVPTCK